MYNRQSMYCTLIYRIHSIVHYSHIVCMYVCYMCPDDLNKDQMKTTTITKNKLYSTHIQDMQVTTPISDAGVGKNWEK